MHAFRLQPFDGARPAGLSRRQLEVLALIAEGERNATIAVELRLAEKTVDHHVSAILRKLGAASRTAAVAEAARRGILTMEEQA